MWYQASQADLAYKLVTGNFKATVMVHAQCGSSTRLRTTARLCGTGHLAPGHGASPVYAGVNLLGAFVELLTIRIRSVSRTHDVSLADQYR